MIIISIPYYSVLFEIILNFSTNSGGCVMPLSGAARQLSPRASAGASQVSGVIAPALPLASRGGGRAKYVLLSLAAFPCLSPRRGEVSRSDGEGARVGASVVAPLRRCAPALPSLQEAGASQVSGAARQLSPRLAAGASQACALNKIISDKYVLFVFVGDLFLLVFAFTSRSRWPWSRAGREP